MAGVSALGVFLWVFLGIRRITYNFSKTRKNNDNFGKTSTEFWQNEHQIVKMKK
jgi:hypothetical protein